MCNKKDDSWVDVLYNHYKQNPAEYDNKMIVFDSIEDVINEYCPDMDEDAEVGEYLADEVEIFQTQDNHYLVFDKGDVKCEK